MLGEKGLSVRGNGRICMLGENGSLSGERGLCVC